MIKWFGTGGDYDYGYSDRRLGDRSSETFAVAGFAKPLTASQAGNYFAGATRELMLHSPVEMVRSWLVFLGLVQSMVTLTAMRLGILKVISVV